LRARVFSFAGVAIQTSILDCHGAKNMRLAMTPEFFEKILVLFKKAESLKLTPTSLPSARGRETKLPLREKKIKVQG
jgi:hypothetical protein